MNGILLANLVGNISSRGEDFLSSAQDRVAESTEQCRRRKYRSRDRNALSDGLGRVTDRVQAGQDRSALTLNVTGHLSDTLRVIRNRTEGVHRDDDANGGQQTGTGQRDREQRQHNRAATKQEGAINRTRDQQCGVHRGLQTQGKTGQDDGCGTGERGLGDIVNRASLSLGEVGGQLLNRSGQHDTDQHRGDSKHTRVKGFHRQ